MTETIAGTYETARPTRLPGATNVVELTRARRRLDQASNAPAVLVCAPAGYGKSLVVASWADRCGGDVGWANLTAVPDQAAAVWSAVVQALIKASPVRAGDLNPLTQLAARAPAEVPARLGRWMGARAGRRCPPGP